MVPSERLSLHSGHQFFLQTVRKGCSQAPVVIPNTIRCRDMCLPCSVQGSKISSQPEGKLYQATWWPSRGPYECSKVTNSSHRGEKQGGLHGGGAIYAEE